MVGGDHTRRRTRAARRLVMVLGGVGRRLGGRRRGTVVLVVGGGRGGGRGVGCVGRVVLLARCVRLGLRIGRRWALLRSLLYGDLG